LEKAVPLAFCRDRREKPLFPWFSVSLVGATVPIEPTGYSLSNTLAKTSNSATILHQHPLMFSAGYMPDLLRLEKPRQQL